MRKTLENSILSLQETSSRLEKCAGSLSDTTYKQLCADFSNCEEARILMEKTNDIQDISLFAWLVREFSQEVNAILDIGDLPGDSDEGIL